MFAEFLRLKGFKRTRLAGVQDITINFTEPFQVFLGTNGSGKTSVMRQATPWPPETEHFLPGGEKEYRVTKEGQVYTLKSFLKGKSWSHEFWQGEVNLNTGGTTAVQKELVTRFFGWTQEIYYLLIGDAKFHQLSTAKRRELFTYLSPTDLTYALGVYNRVKTKARDNLGVRKHLEQRIAQEAVKLIDDETSARYAQEARKLQEETQILLMNRKMDTDTKVDEEYLQNLVGQQRYRLEALREFNIDSVGFPSLEALEHAVRLSNNRLVELSTKRDALRSESIDLNATLNDIRNRSLGSKEEVEQRLKAAQERLATLKVSERFQIPENAKEAYSETEEFEKPLIENLTALIGLTTLEFDFSPTAEAAFKENLNATRNTLQEHQRAYERLRQRQEHLEHAQDVECPQCATRFVAGERKGEREQLVQRLAAGAGSISVLETKYTQLQEIESHYSEYNYLLQQIRQVAAAYPRCRGLFNAMVDYGFPTKLSQQLIGLVFDWKQCLYDAWQYRVYAEQVSTLSQALEQLKLSDGESGVVLQGRAAVLDAQIQELQKQVTLEQLRYDELAGLLERLERWDYEVAQITRGQEYLDWATKQAIDNLRNAIIDQTLADHQTQLAQVTARLKEHDVALALLADLQNQLTDAKAKELAYADVLSALSPTDGLIAEQLSGFIASFVKSMNVILARVWTYPLRVLPCGIEKEELNYRFPIEVGHEREPADDVQCGSEAQRDVFDFAFVLALSLHIDPHGIPLYLDELGSSFDEEHRAKIWQFVRDYVDAGKAPQAFMISHYAANHTALANAEIFVVDSNNISVPRKHNEHVVLK